MVDNGTRPMCFCPPSFYGDRCQYNQRRVLVRVRFERQYRSKIASILQVLVLLVYNRSNIIDHQTFIDIEQYFPPKHDLYLIYPKPKPNGIFSVRFEAYSNMQLLSIWEYQISPLDFLPVFQLAKILRLSDRTLPLLCSINVCKNNGTCYVLNENDVQWTCICSHGWKGKHCDESLALNEQMTCAPNGLARYDDICVCPRGYLLPNCFIQNTICEDSKPCSFDEICYPLSTLPPNQYVCLCRSRILAHCHKQKAHIVLQLKEPNQYPFLIQLLKFSSDYPRLRQQMLIPARTEFPISLSMNTFERKSPQGAVPEIGLLYTFNARETLVEIQLNFLLINCTNSVRNYTVDLDRQLQKCHSLHDDPRRDLVKLYHTLCRESKFNPCFYSTNYVCYCSTSTNRSECISYQQIGIECQHCINQGYCVQADLQNRSDFVCICPKCVTGDLCQFSSSPFSISLEMLIEMTRWGRLNFIIPVIFLLVSMICNGICIIIFKQSAARTVGTGFYLLVNTIISQLVLSLLLFRVIYLVIIRPLMENRLANEIICKSLPYLMTSLDNLSFWLMSFVTAERAMGVIFVKRFQLLRTPKWAFTLSALISVLIFSSLSYHIVCYRLVSKPDDVHSWCVLEIPPNHATLIQYTSLAFRIIPFIVNILAALAIIIGTGFSKARVHRIPQHNALATQIRQRIDLLLAPFVCFLTQTPQMIILFLDACTYDGSTVFPHITLIVYYISFTPHMSLFFIYVLPSPLFKRLLFTKTKLGKFLAKFQTK